MKSQRIASGGKGETLVVVLDDGEEAFSALQGFARKENVSAASLTAIGAFSRATVGWFDFASKSYKEIAVEEQCEVLSAIGDVAVGDDGKASLHVHIVLGLSDGSTRGGHLLKGTVHPTLEVVLTETPAKLRRRKRPGLGIALIDADPEEAPQSYGVNLPT
ncbi:MULTISPECIES: PPC domain-containing DNA-binding protein [Rhodopseudomonas]|uniref:PPC domain-containing DNA-binding protein n=1 Tax=Rhodopseudomonas TaxID=1073 RepID=UPI0005C92F9E|nr:MULTISPECIES: PPC domain-containing DNA-binding protein [Rhodopseudomonas]MDF3813241.1 DNA-binding protein [Rhodopseudomonas sp. BAL398]WOK21016.1 DNA-binding protein [Rhodopseudomonas sp. BAL398]